MRSIWIASALFMLIIGTQVSCSEDKIFFTGDFELADLPYERLSDYDLFEGNLADLIPSDKIVPYDLNAPLFSDYSEKDRFIYIPTDAQIEYQENTVLDFPVGTIIFKNFSFYDDFRDPGLGKRILETRLLVHYPDGWKAFPYRWNSSQTDADYTVVGGPIEVSWTHFDGSARSTFYLIPNQVECEACHQIGDDMQPIGPKAGNMNRDFDFASGTQNQLDYLVQKGWLSGAPTSPEAPSFPQWDDPAEDIDRRARAYLEVNCAHCHRPEGDANNSGLFLNLENEDLSALGICKPPVATGGGSGDLDYAIVPGSSDSSILVYRMESTQLDEAMPEIGRSVIHEEGIALIREWIDTMPYEGCP